MAASSQQSPANTARGALIRGGSAPRGRETSRPVSVRARSRRQPCTDGWVGGPGDALRGCFEGWRCGSPFSAGPRAPVAGLCPHSRPGLVHQGRSAGSSAEGGPHWASGALRWQGVKGSELGSEEEMQRGSGPTLSALSWAKGAEAGGERPAGSPAAGRARDAKARSQGGARPRERIASWALAPRGAGRAAKTGTARRAADGAPRPFPEPQCPPL